MNPATMESRNERNLFHHRELLDIDGDSGGTIFIRLEQRSAAGLAQSRNPEGPLFR
jgi:predicted flavoprotein YhiN